MQVLVVNAGSSSLKLRLLDADDTVVQSADIPVGSDGFDAAPLHAHLADWATPDAVGHRIVHGGTAFAGPTLINDDVRGQLHDLIQLAPMHQPNSLAALEAVSAVLPDVRAVASFDTAFHRTIPAAAATYAIPREWRERYGIRRFGFHGLSHAYASRRAAELVQRPVEQLRIITCHLGAGASLAAVLGGQCVDTTMGFTPLEGLVMATRSGSVDPGLVLWLVEKQGLSSHDVATALTERSGLLALAGTADMREVEAAAQNGDLDASLAIDIYIHRLSAGIAAMSASTGGLDVLVFTGGVGEHSALVRRLAAGRLGYLGVAIDGECNDTVAGDGDVSAPGAAVQSLVITAREDEQIAREARSVLAGNNWEGDDVSTRSSR